MKTFLWIIFLLLQVTTSNAQKRALKDTLFQKSYIKIISEKCYNWQRQNQPDTIVTDWKNSVFLIGAFSANNAFGITGFDKFLDSIGTANKWEPGKRLYHADDYAISQVYIDYSRKVNNPDIVKPTLDAVNNILDKPYLGSKIKKKGFDNDLEMSIMWWWSDALFMMPPVLVKLGDELGDDKFLKLNDELFTQTIHLLYDQDDKLFYRDSRFIVHNNSEEKIFWSRGNAWVLAGLAKVLSELPEDYSGRSKYLELFTDMANRIIILQDSVGLWKVNLTNQNFNSHGETSSTALFTYALAWGINNGVLDEKIFLPHVSKGWISLNGCIHPNGMLGWVQPVGSMPENNFSAESWELFGTGAFLMAASEVYSLKK